MRRFLSQIFFYSIFSFVSVSIVYAQSSAEYNSFLTPQNRLKFGNYLFCTEDYLRAVYEFREALTEYSSDTLQFKLAYAFSKMGRYSEAADNFKSLFINFNLSEEAKFEFFKSRFLSLSPEEFRAELKLSQFKPHVYGDNLKKMELFSHLLDDGILPDSAEFAEYFSSADEQPALDFWHAKKYPDLRDPLTAAVFSAIIPGAGKVYTEQYGDAVTAFLFTGLLTYAAVDNFNAGHKTRGWVLGSFAALFYGGNVYGSYSSAQIFNAKIRFDFEHDVAAYLKKVDYFSPIYKFLCGD